MTRKIGRQFLSNRGPATIPSSVVRAMDQPAVNFTDRDFMRLSV